MSMWLSLARVSPDALSAILESPELMEAIFFDDDAPAKAAELGIEADHCCGVDFLTLSQVHAAMAEAMGEDEPDDVLDDDLAPTGVVDFDAGYGPGFFCSAEAAKAALETSMLPELDDDARRVMAAAAAAGEALVGVVS